MGLLTTMGGTGGRAPRAAPQSPPGPRAVRSCRGPDRRRYGEEIQQGQGEEAKTPGGAGGDGCRLRQGGGSQQARRPPRSLPGVQKIRPQRPRCLHRVPPRPPPGTGHPGVGFRADQEQHADAVSAPPCEPRNPRVLPQKPRRRCGGGPPGGVFPRRYEQSEWGWKEREKREELGDDRAWYLIARDAAAGPVAFSHFRFDVECGEEVLYCYEVQLESRVRRRGLGKFLLQILQLVANSTQMKKVMLTVFKHNHGAYHFFRDALQFDIDDTSPSVSGCCGDDCSYEILSRRTKFGESQHAHPGGHCGGCCH